MNVRIIPALSLLDGTLVKTSKFSAPAYVGDPINTIRIFNELEVDEVCILGIRTTISNNPPDYKLIEAMATECFMPLSYGGGINSLETAKKIFQCGVEKIILGTSAIQNPSFITQCSLHYGTQAVVVAIDVKKSLFNQYAVMSHSGTVNTHLHPLKWAQEAEAAGAGEILLTSINREGSWNGFDTVLVKEVSAGVSIPVIAHGGAGTPQHISEVIISGASAVAAGSMFLYQKKGLGILINFPKQKIEEAIAGI
ncbi:MAG: histidine biosynthesis protein [Flavisolibacter sp.]|jgi:cyclase|nr:histidine biosynthesis protein [Flavisolibacter sp.]